MRKTILALLLLAGLAVAHPGGVLEQHLVSRFYRVQPSAVSALAASHAQEMVMRAGKPGDKFSDLVDLRDCSSVETGLDEIAWPSPLVPELLLRAHKVDYKSLPPLHLRPAGALTLTWPGNQALRIQLFTGVTDRARVGDQWFRIAPAVDEAQAKVLRKQVLAGKTRAEIERVLVADGGLSRPFQLERYVLRSSSGHPTVVKVNLEFRASEGSHPGPKDLVLRVSPPYRQPAYFD